MTSACEHVLTTPELLEIVLLHLHHVAPPNELLRSQLVSRRFRTAITSSPRIQQLLFLRAEPASALNPWRINPLLRRHFLPWFVGPPRDHYAMPNNETLRLMDWTSCKAEAFLRPEASWRKMLFVQPPPEELCVKRACLGEVCNSVQEAKVSFADSASGGVTMGLIYDITESFLRGGAVSRFGVSVNNCGQGPPHITLHLRFTQKPHISPRDMDFMSHGATSQWTVETLEWTPFDRKSRWDRREIIDWMTDLSVEKGGVQRWAWEEWKRKRAPIRI